MYWYTVGDPVVYYVPSLILSWGIMYYPKIRAGLFCTIPRHVLVYSGQDLGPGPGFGPIRAMSRLSSFQPRTQIWASNSGDWSDLATIQRTDFMHAAIADLPFLRPRYLCLLALDSRAGYIVILVDGMVDAERRLRPGFGVSFRGLFKRKICQLV